MDKPKEILTARKNTCTLDRKFVIKNILYFVSKFMVSFTQAWKENQAISEKQENSIQ